MSKDSGTLYICPTPIGNLEDITLRALKTLKECDLIAAEDTRHTKKLMNYYDIHTPITSYYAHNEQKKGIKLIEKLKQGINIALVSDAGMPGISDPGSDLIKLAIEHDINIVVLPGASAVIAALIASGMPTDKFVFEGFLPSGKTKRRKRLKELTCEERTMVFYESPHRLIEMLKDIHDILGNRRAAVIRELTKLHEEIKRGALLEIIKYFEQQKPRGEFTIVLSGAQREKLNMPISSEEVITRVKEFTDKGMSTKDAVRKTAELFKIPKREVYDIVNKAFN